MNESNKKLLRISILYIFWNLITAVITSFLPDIFPVLKTHLGLKFLYTFITYLIIGAVALWIYYKKVTDKSEKAISKKIIIIVIIFLILSVSTLFIIS